jgi:ATP-binding protein involved in chromosome partitioning
MAELSTPDRAAVLAALDRVRDPKSGRGLAAAGLVQALVVGPDRAGFMIEVAAADAALYAPVRDEAEAVLRKVSGAGKVQVVLTASAGPAGPAGGTGASAERPPDPGIVRVRRGARLSPQAQAQMSPAQPTAALKPANVRHVAVAMAMLGRRVGLLDADVYGPSIPRMSGLDAEPELNAERKLVPLEAWGLKIMSIGFLVDEGAPMIWRGPIASSALNQMLNDVAWASDAAPMDVLVIDMPPGTGDVQLTLAQRVALSGAVVVSTPQEVALIDVRRGVAMFEKTHVPILGVVENMAYFPDPSTGEPIPIFGRGGAKTTAEALGAPFLGEIPIDVALRQACDDGRPFVADGGDSAASKAFLSIAERVLDALDHTSLKPPPRIVFED